VLTPSAIFLLVEGSASRNIAVNGGDIQKARESLVVEKGAVKSAVRMQV
jgi:hypothetical protein